jgi:hypothetical protein
MTQIEFFSVHDVQVIARAQAGEPAAIPSVGDRAFVPRNRNARVHLQVARRQFIYDDHGTLTTVKLSCISLADDREPEHRQRRRAEKPIVRHRSVSRARAQNSGFPFTCPRCACLMTLHQPDPELTDCLLAICEYCKSWYLTNPAETKLSLIYQPRERPSRR